jgi:type II secretory ATPase GspE/PulE/Tfp pilus assembly ATPase PilB-like protein
MKRANADEVRKAAIAGGMVTMTQDGFEKALEGTTTIEEILRVFHE